MATPTYGCRLPSGSPFVTASTGTIATSTATTSDTRITLRMLPPVMDRARSARKRTRRTNCLSSEEQIVTASLLNVNLSCSDHDERQPELRRALIDRGDV